MAKNLVIYHKKCDDGFGAALAAWEKLKDDAEYLEVDYHSPLPLYLMKDRLVTVIDFCYSPDQVYSHILPVCKSLRILDHHKSSMKDWMTYLPAKGESTFLSSDGKSLTHFEPRLVVDFDMDKSGALLSWEHFHPTLEVPKFIQHISDHDLWKFQIPQTKEFSAYLRSQTRTFNRWKLVMENLENDRRQREDIYEVGSAILRSTQLQVESESESSIIREIEIEDMDEKIHKGLATNTSKMFASDLGNVLAVKSGSFAIVWTTDGREAFCSVRSVSGFNCIPLCKKYGGGGHEAAGGFVLDLQQFLKLLR